MTGDTIAVGNPVVNRFISHQRKYIEKDKEARFAKISQTFLRLPVTLKSLKMMVNPEPLESQGQVSGLQSHSFVCQSIDGCLGDQRNDGLVLIAVCIHCFTKFVSILFLIATKSNIYPARPVIFPSLKLFAKCFCLRYPTCKCARHVVEFQQLLIKRS